MVLSNHHHLRDGDKVAFDDAGSRRQDRFKDLLWFPSASFPLRNPPSTSWKKASSTTSKAP